MAIIFIAGLARSGTTFLQSQLLKYDNVVAIGEVAQTVRAIKGISTKIPAWKIKAGIKSENYWDTDNYEKLLKLIKEDSFWGPIENEIRNTADVITAIKLVYSKAIEKYPGHIIIDSSKHIGHLLKISEAAELKESIKVLLCIRDYRGWLYSIKKHQKRTNIQTRNNLIEIYKWLYSNKKILRILNLHFKKSFKTISYEKLIFSHSQVIKELELFCDFSQLANYNIKDKFHEILGSHSLKDSFEKKELMYDHTWFTYIGYGLLEYPVKYFNKKIYFKS